MEAVILGGLTGVTAVVGVWLVRARRSDLADVFEDETGGHRALRCAGAALLFLLGLLTGLAFAFLAGTTTSP